MKTPKKPPGNFIGAAVPLKAPWSASTWLRTARIRPSRDGGDLALHDVVAGEAAGDEVLGAVLGPLHRPAGDHRADDRAHVARIDRHLVAEAAADVGRDDPDAVLGDAGEVGVERAVGVRRLGRAPEGELLARCGRSRRPRRRSRAAPGARAGRRSPARSSTSARAKTAAVAAASPVSQSKQWLSVLPSTSSRISGVSGSSARRTSTTGSSTSYSTSISSSASRAAYRSSATTKATSWPWNRTLSVASTAWTSPGEGRHPRQAALVEHRAGDDGLDLRVRLGGGGVDADQAGVGHRRAEHGEVEHPRELDVVAVAALAAHEPLVLLAEHPAVAPDHGRRSRQPGHAGSPWGCSAAHWTDLTMLA